MSSLSLLMENYFKPLDQKENVSSSIVKIKKNTWEKKEETLFKKFSFENRKVLEAFVVSVMKYLREAEVDLGFSLRSLDVIVKIYALSPYLSEIEIESSKEIDKIFKDVFYYYTEE